MIDAMKAYREDRWDTVPLREHRGLAKGEGCLLDERHQQTIQALIREYMPDELGLPSMLWIRLTKGPAPSG